MARGSGTVFHRLLALPSPSPWVLLAFIPAILLALLTIAIINNPVPSQDLAVMDWIKAWDNPGLLAFSQWLVYLPAPRPA